MADFRLKSRQIAPLVVIRRGLHLNGLKALRTANSIKNLLANFVVLH